MKYAVEQLGAKHLVCPQPTVPGADWICDGMQKYAESKGIGFSRFLVDQQTVDNDSFVQQILIGVILVLAVAVDQRAALRGAER